VKYDRITVLGGLNLAIRTGADTERSLRRWIGYTSDNVTPEAGSPKNLLQSILSAWNMDRCPRISW